MTVPLSQTLVRKIDWRIMLWAAISFSALNIDRSNISQANSDSFLPDLGVSKPIPHYPKSEADHRLLPVDD